MAKYVYDTIGVTIPKKIFEGKYTLVGKNVIVEVCICIYMCIYICIHIYIYIYVRIYMNI
jgi:hypothetical protein